MSELLRAEKVSKTWDAGGPAPVHAVRDVSLTLVAGECVVVTGPSGSGKTTLLSILGGLLTPDAGRVSFCGEPLSSLGEPARRALRLRSIGVVFQRGLLLENLTARDNVALMRQATGVTGAEAIRRADGLLAAVGLAERAGLLPAALSAGECQRVAVARALAMRPRLVLADEPTAHLDGPAGARVMAVMRALVREHAASLLVVSHDARVVADGDRVLRLEDGALRPSPS